MTRLVPMREALFPRFREETVGSYAEDNVTAGRWPAADAQQRAAQEFSRLLPEGLRTPGHWLYEILEDATDDTVGFLWFAVQGSDRLRSGYVYNIRVLPRFGAAGMRRPRWRSSRTSLPAWGSTASACMCSPSTRQRRHCIDRSAMASPGSTCASA